MKWQTLLLVAAGALAVGLSTPRIKEGCLHCQNSPASPLTVPAAESSLIDFSAWQEWVGPPMPASKEPMFKSGPPGTLSVSGKGNAYLRTAEKWGDFRLSGEFRWGHPMGSPDKAMDSGLFIHAVGPDQNSHDAEGAFLACVEVNLMQGACGDLLLLRGNDADGKLISPMIEAEVAPEKDAEGWFTWREGGARTRITTWGRLNWKQKSPVWRDYYGFRGPNEVEVRDGDWNQLVVECRNSRLRVHLNGVLVNEATILHPAEGYLAVQCEWSSLEFRNMRLHP